MTKKHSAGDASASAQTASTPPDPLAQAVADAAATDDRVLQLERKVAELTEQLKQYSEAASRAQAELGNAKMRMEKEAADIRTFASASTLRRFLPTIDNLQRALKALPSELADHPWVKGIVALEQAFLKEVGELGLRRFDVVGQRVDPLRHEVLLQVPGEAGMVIDVLEDGYELHGKVIRPAKVKVGGG